ncbi:LPS export ABC transporter periplasmic protein LptC, partial [Gemmatimonadota bacterium]
MSKKQTIKINKKKMPCARVFWAFFVSILLLVSGCSIDAPEKMSGSEDESSTVIPDQVFDGFEMTITEDGIKKGWIKGLRAERYESKKIFLVSRPEVIFYSTAGSVQSVMTSLRGLIHISSGDMEAFDSVVVISA